MDSVISINSLELSEELKTLLKDNEIYTVDDFIKHSINVFKKYFQLTFDDWRSIIKVFITLHAVKQVQDGVVRATLAKTNKKKETPSNALIVNLFDEKYVVSTIKKGKWLHDDYVFKSLARGIVFSSLEDAQNFAELIRANNQSRVIVYDIKNAQDTINVIVALNADRKNAVILFGKSKSEESILQALTDENNFVSTHRAYKLALAAVERINRIYDYEIAVLLAFACGEKGLVALEISPEDATDDRSSNTYICKPKYAKCLEKLIDKKGDDYFTWGKNAAISDSQQRSISCIEARIYKCLQRLGEFEDVVGITEEDVAYENGYIEGLKIALKIQKEFVSDFLIGKVALIDCWEVASKLGIDTKTLIGSIKDSNCEIIIDYFDNFDMLNEKVAEYDAFYLIFGGRMSHLEEDAFFNLQMQFYEMHKKQLYHICVSKNFNKQFFKDLFLLDDIDGEEEQ